MGNILEYEAFYAGTKPVRKLMAGTRQVWSSSGSVVTPPGGGAVALSSTVMTAPTFPLSKRTDGRGFKDAANKPFIGLADTIWNGMSRMTLSEWTSYINTRRAQGFTSVLTSMLDINSRSRTQATTGVTPFTGTNDSANFTAPNQTYFNAVKAKLDVAQGAGIFVWIVPAWFGYRGDRWRPNWASSATDYTKAQSYANYLAAQFGSRSGIGWLHGGDNNPDTLNNAADNSSVKVSLVGVTNVFAETLRDNSPQFQFMTYHTGRSYDAATWFKDEPWFDIDAAYSGVDVPVETTAEWNRGRAVMFTEGYYENRQLVGGNPGTTVPAPHLSRDQVRAVAYQAIFTGAFMQANGNEYVWPVRDWYSGNVWDDATNGVNSVGAQDLKILSRVLASFPDKNWMPDAASPIVISNRNTGASMAPGVRSLDNEAAIIYVPTNRTVTVNITGMTPGRGAIWVHPGTGSTQAVPIPSKSFTVTTPSGWTDGVLMFGNSANATTPGTYTGTYAATY